MTARTGSDPSLTEPDESAIPDQPVSGTWLWLYGLAWLGFWLLAMLPGQVMLAQLSKALDPARKVELVSLFQAGCC